MKGADRWQQRREHAQQRLAVADVNAWHFAILGIRTDVEEYHFHDTIRLQPVTEPPGEVELAGALKQNTLFGAIGRYSHNIGYELAIDGRPGRDDQAAFNMAWWIISVLRVRSLAEILIPCVADPSGPRSQLFRTSQYMSSSSKTSQWPAHWVSPRR